MHHDIILLMHHIDFFLYFFCANLQSVLSFFLFVLFVFVLVSCPYPSTMPRNTKAHKTASSPSESPFQSELFRSEKNKELYETLNIKRKIWVERRGWLPLLDIGHPPLVALIRDFYSNISIHIYDSSTLVKSWIRGVEYTITPRVVADALGVPLVQHPVYPYDESPPLDDIMSYITGSSIRWGSDPRITSTKLIETTYLFFRIACHSLWPISHLHTIPLERCAFLYVPYYALNILELSFLVPHPLLPLL